MTTKRPSAAESARDAENAREATTDYFQHELDQARAAVRVAMAAVETAEARRRQVEDGDRLSENEALIVFGTVQDQAVKVGSAAIDGKATREEYETATERAESVRRGLVADGYDIPDYSHRTGARR
ncbi:hypothetical protein ABZW10_36370 [Kitasatospora sp. NPDC004723]|uniref:hypothetical protein n=1 Tax=Kitasatospora sp. NPDC004723 TaxID=3154288 RepID=UPI0033A379CD